MTRATHANIAAMTVGDTTPEAQAVQWEVQRSLSGEQRVLIALEMSLLVRELNRAGIRCEHPDWTEAEVQRELIRRTFLPGEVPAGLR